MNIFRKFDNCSPGNLVICYIIVATLCATPVFAGPASSNIPIDSPIYLYLEKLSGFGLINSDVKGIKPFSRSEAARLYVEAQSNAGSQASAPPKLVLELLTRIRELLPRESYLQQKPDSHPVLLDFNPMVSMRQRYVYLDGVPRSYERRVHDPGGDGVFGIGSGLRPKNPYPSPAIHHGSEGTPLVENNNGTVYKPGHNFELRWAAEGYLGSMAIGLIEPAVIQSLHSADTTLKLNRGYLKLGGGGLELEAGIDENWLGLGYRGAITLTNNSENLVQVKLSSPEPLTVPYVGLFKYAIIASRLDRTVTDGVERQPWFYALKLSIKPTDNLELGFNLGRQVGGPGVSNSAGDILRGLVGGTNADNSNGLAGFEMRYRVPWLRNMELYGEFSGEDVASIWPIAESYVAGFFIPRLTEGGRDDLRFEFFQGNQILYTNYPTFPGGYLYKGMPLGHSQGGATQDFFTRYSHWFGARNNVALEYIYTNRGMASRMPGQAIERKHSGRISWNLPLYGDVNAHIMYGIEGITNLNLQYGDNRTNQIVRIDLNYRY